MSGRLDGRVLVCTGAGSGIGRATLDAFVAEGAVVAVLERDAAKVAELAGFGDAVLVVGGDARSAADNRAVAEAALRRWDRIDGAVTFVGIFDHYRPLEGIDPDELAAAFDEMFEVNVLATMMTARVVLPALRQSRGSLVFTLSSSSFFAGRGGALYVSSKFALRGLVTQLAYEAAPEVRVNGVAPGGTLGTDLRGPASLGLAEERLADRPGRREQLEARTPLHVALAAGDHAGAYLYLLGDDSRGVTGEIIRSDGGLSVR